VILYSFRYSLYFGVRYVFCSILEHFVKKHHSSIKIKDVASPFDLTSFGGFNCFGIESNDVCDDAGTVLSFQMSSKHDGEGHSFDAALMRLLAGASKALAEEEEEEEEDYNTRREEQGPDDTTIIGRRHCYSKMARWTDLVVSEEQVQVLVLH
jgi:hypothetical protein